MSEVSENAVKTCIKYFRFFFFVAPQTLKYATNADIKQKFYDCCCCCGVSHALGALVRFFCSIFIFPCQRGVAPEERKILHLNERMQHSLARI